jgi:AcrR family transcriptional regulator
MNSQRERILSHVEKKLFDEGRTEFSIDEIAGALGISKKTFYKVFPTKDAMLEELVARIVEEVSRRIDAIAQGPGSFVEKIVALMRFLGSTYRLFGVLLSEEVHRRLPGVWERIDTFRQKKIQVVFSRLLDQGMAEGLVRNDLDRRVFLMAFTAAVRAIVQPIVLAANAFTIPDVMEQIVGIFFAGIMTDAGQAAFGELEQRQQSQLH